MRDLLVYALLALAAYLGWYVIWNVVQAVRRLEERDELEARTRG